MTHEEREALEAQANMLLADKDEPELVDHTDGETIACKTGRKNKRLFERLCEEQLHCTKNEALQMVIDCLIRYMDDRHNLSEELNTMISLFEGFHRWGNHINLAEPIERSTIIAAIYILARRDKSGNRMVMVEGADGELTRTETFNTQLMLDIFLEAYDEQLYRNLRLVSAAMGCKSISYALHRLVAEFNTDDIQESIRKMFEDNRRGEYGQHDLPEGGPYRRTMNNSLSDYERKLEEWNRTHPQLSLWTDEDQINETF